MKGTMDSSGWLNPYEELIGRAGAHRHVFWDENHMVMGENAPVC